MPGERIAPLWHVACNRARPMLRLLKRTFEEWKADHCPSMAAALSYYTLFSLPPLLLLVLTAVGLFVDPADVEGRITDEIGGVIGAGSAAQVTEMIRNVSRPDSGGTLVSLLSIGGLLLGATGAFAELQLALNRAWSVAPDPEKGGLLAMLGKRVLSLGMVLTIAFLLLVSLALSAVVSAFGQQLAPYLPGALSEGLLQLLTSAASFLVIAILFGLIFKIMPDAEIGWRDVVVGAVGTALLFVVGKFLLGEYIARSDPGEAFGAAGSLAVVLVWIYYSAMIVLFGAEFTQVWAVERGSGIRPDENAVRVVQSTKHVGESAASSRD